MTNLKLANYLKIALKQRERALQKFMSDYGPGSATVKECTAETAELKIYISKLETGGEQLDLENAKSAPRK